MSRFAKSVLALTVLLAALGLIFLQRGPAGGVAIAIDTAAAPEADEATVRLVDGAQGAAGPSPERKTLPPINAPLVTILEPLAARADAGDAKAACRLAMELIRCQAADVYREIPAFDDSRMEIEFEAKGDLDTADRLAKAQLARLHIEQECLAVPPRLRNRAAHYLGQAARAGEPEAMVRYANGDLWPPDARGVYSDPEFDRWRRDASAMLDRAFAMGIPEAPMLLMFANQDDYSDLGGLIPDDPIKAEALRMLMVRLHGWRERLVPSQLDAASLEKARALAKQWHEGPFKGRSYRGQQRAMFQFAGLPKHDGSPHELCVDGLPTP